MARCGFWRNGWAAVTGQTKPAKAKRSRRTCTTVADLGGDRQLRADAEWPHHLVVLMLEDVAVEDEQAGTVEQRLDPGDLVRVGDHGVLATGLPALRRPWVAADWLPLHHLEGDLVDVNRMGIGGEVVDLRCLRGRCWSARWRTPAR